jgi:hypothetical protein
VNSLSLAVISLTVLACVAFVVRLVVWCLVDLSRHGWDVTSSERQLWIAALVLLGAISVMAYVSIGPGRDRWDRRFLWHRMEN